jgi:hypothetical protein
MSITEPTHRTAPRARRFYSRRRRHLWRILHDGGAQGSRQELATQLKVSATIIERDLEAMCAAGIVVCERIGSRLVYRAQR